MRMLHAALAVSLLATSACTRNAWIDRLPPELRAEARALVPIRKKECDALQASTAPSRDQSGGFSILGVDIRFRDAQFSTSGVRDRYFLAVNHILTACRRWQRFEPGSDEQYRAAQLRAADIAMGPLREAGDRDAIERLATALGEARAAAGAGTETVQQEIARLRELFEARAGEGDDPALARRFDGIETSLRSLEKEVSKLSVREGAAPARTEWQVRFDRASSLPGLGDIERIRQSIADWAQRCGDMELVVTGYADSSGSSESNLQLAKARAEAVHRAIGDLARASTLVGAFGETSHFGPAAEANRIVSVRAICFGTRSPPASAA